MFLCHFTILVKISDCEKKLRNLGSYKYLKGTLVSVTTTGEFLLYYYANILQFVEETREKITEQANKHTDRKPPQCIKQLNVNTTFRRMV